jgi:hypothetical protein
MAELINKKAAPPEPFKIGEDPKIKVKAKRPVLLGHHDGGDTPTRVEKDEVGFVTEAEFKRHAHILEKVAALVLFIGLLFASSAQAQSYSANITIPAPVTNANGTNLFYSTNANVVTGFIAGGAMATNVGGTNIIAANTTNSAVLATPVGLTRYDQATVMFSGSVVSNTSGTFWLFLYPCADGVNIDTNHPIATMSCSTSSGSTGFLLVTNLPNSVLGSTGYLGAGIGVQGTNSTADHCVQFFVKPQRSG